MKHMKKILAFMIMPLLLATLAFANWTCDKCGADLPDTAKMTKQVVDGKEISVCEACAPAKTE